MRGIANIMQPILNAQTYICICISCFKNLKNLFKKRNKVLRRVVFSTDYCFNFEINQKNKYI